MSSSGGTGEDFAFDWTQLSPTSSDASSLYSTECSDRCGTGDLLTNAEGLLFKYYQQRQQRNEDVFQTKAKEKKFLALLSLSLQNAAESSATTDKEKDEAERDMNASPSSLDEPPSDTAARVDMAKPAAPPILPPKDRLPPKPSAPQTSVTPITASINTVDASTSSAALTAGGGAKIAKRKIGELSSATATSAPAKIEDPNKVFSTPGLLLLEDWDPRKASDALCLKLPGFGFDAFQTIAFKVSVRSDFKRWSFNIAPANHEHYNNILFHFAPSFHKKRAEHQLVLNDKVGTWGSGLKESFKVNDPIAPSNRVMQVVVQIDPLGFFVFANDRFRSFFPHRRDVTQMKNLCFFILSKDENGNPEEAVVHNVWWGRTDPAERAKLLPNMKLLTGNMAEYQIPAVPFELLTVIVRGLPVINDYNEIQFVEAALRDVFDEFGPVSINVVRGMAMAYVRLAQVGAVGAAVAALIGTAMQGPSGSEMVLECVAMARAG